WLDVQHDLAVLEDADRARRLTDGHGYRLRLAADGRRRPVPAAQPLAERDPLGRDVEVDAGGDGDTVAADQDRAFELGQVLDLFAHPAVTDVELSGRVAEKRVTVERPREHLSLRRVTVVEQSD